MIHYNVRCSHDHEFDGWYKDSAAFDRLTRRGLIECPSCGDTKVERALMAPAVATREALPVPMTAPPPPAQGASAPPTAPPMAMAGGPMPDQMRAMLQRMRAEVEKSCDYVGQTFADEARKIHRGEAEPRSIYGETTPEQAETLSDEGIEFSRIPWVPRGRWVSAQAEAPAGAALAVERLRTEFRIQGAWYAAVDDISFSIAPRETLALVGESGCGKSITALSVMGLVPHPQGRIAGGRVLLDGTDLVTLAEPALEKLRGARVAMIFQEPMTSLNPVMTVGAQVAEALIVHQGLSRRAAEAKALAVLEEVKIPSAAGRFHEYPHQFSGGMRQRVMIAMAIACEPAVLLADEPTTALDVTIQAQVLGLLADLRERHGMAMLFITHNLGVVAQIADRVAVMYAGQIVEQAPVAAIFARPAHPYTRALFAAIPRLDVPDQPLAAIPGRVPPLDGMPAGCRFAPRCPMARAGCELPQVLATVSAGHSARCHVATGLRDAA